MIPIIVICGPTATGKTKLSIELCKAFEGEVVSADSMQIYKGLDIGSAKPTQEEREGIAHHMMSFVEPNVQFSVSDYCLGANKAIEAIALQGKVPVLVGGTGLYIDSLIENVEFFDIPNDYAYREELEKLATKEGTHVLYDMLLGIDPIACAQINQNDRKRLIRALEIYHTTGKTKTYFVQRSKQRPKLYTPLYIGLCYKDRATLYEKIHRRVDLMLAQGLLPEVNRLLKQDGFRSSSASAGIGYKEIISYFDGVSTLDEAIAQVKLASTRYAKRQMTWFGKNKAIRWITIDDKADFEEVITQARVWAHDFLKESLK